MTTSPDRDVRIGVDPTSITDVTYVAVVRDLYTGAWQRLNEVVNHSYTVMFTDVQESVRTFFTDRGDEDRMTSTDTTTTEATTESDTEATVTPESFRLTRAILHELGSCGSYVRKFSETFPVEQYPDGMIVDQETCVVYHDLFDWEWAVSRMLNHPGVVAHDRLMRSRAAENRHFGTGTARRAAIFGHLFATRPDYRHEDTVTVHERVVQREDEQAVHDIGRVRRAIEVSQREVENLTRRIAEDQERLPKLEALAAGALLRIAQRKHRAALRAVERQRERLLNSERIAAETAAEVERLTELESSGLAATVPDDASSLTPPILVERSREDELF